MKRDEATCGWLLTYMCADKGNRVTIAL